MTSTFSKNVALAVVAIALAGSSPIAVRANVLHKHPTAAGIGAGLVAHHMAKKAARHGSHSIVARHPVATGIAAGIATHHVLKHHS